MGQVGLIVRACAAVQGSKPLDLPIGASVLRTVQSRRRGARNCDELRSVKGVTAAIHGASIGALAGGVGRQTPGSVPPVNGGGAGTGKLRHPFAGR